MRFGLEQHLSVGIVGECEPTARLHGASAKPTPERHESVLSMTIDPGISFEPCQPDPCPYDLESEKRAPEFMSDCEPLQFREIGEEANPHTSGRFAPHGRDQMQRAEIVAVELLFIRTGLLGEIHGRADGDYLH